MKFEFVEFYPLHEKLKEKDSKLLGSVHIYFIESELDIRGIRVIKNNKDLFFKFPHATTLDEDGEKVTYPHIRFANEKTHVEMMDFLHQVVKPEIFKKLKIIEKGLK